MPPIIQQFVSWIACIWRFLLRILKFVLPKRSKKHQATASSTVSESDNPPRKKDDSLKNNAQEERDNTNEAELTNARLIEAILQPDSDRHQRDLSCLHGVIEMEMSRPIAEIYPETIMALQNDERKMMEMLHHDASQNFGTKDSKEGKFYRIHPNIIDDLQAYSFWMNEDAEIKALQKNLDEAKQSKACLGVTLSMDGHFMPTVMDVSAGKPVVYSFEMMNGTDGELDVAEQKIRQLMAKLGYASEDFDVVPRQWTIPNNNRDSPNRNEYDARATFFHLCMAALSEEDMRAVLNPAIYEPHQSLSERDGKNFSDKEESNQSMALLHPWQKGLPPSSSPKGTTIGAIVRSFFGFS
jgi:hypothetical protein